MTIAEYLIARTGSAAVPVTGTVTATVDTTALATQTTLAAVLAKLIAAPATAALQTAANVIATTIAELLPSPTLPTAITAHDDTDLTALANVGVIIGGAGNLAFRMTGAPSTTVALAVVAGQFVPGQFTRIMAATTATNIVGLARS